MSGNRREGSSLGTGGVVALVVIAAGLLGGLGSALAVLAVAAGVIALIVIAVLLFAFKGSGSDTAQSVGTSQADPEDAKILSQARRDVTELKRLNLNLKNREIRQLAEENCGLIDKILAAMKEDPEKISAGQLYLQYYLPTQKTILTKYSQIETGGIDSEGLEEKVKAHLKEIKEASSKQLEKLFDDDLSDISAELELLKASLEQDGLV